MSFDTYSENNVKRRFYFIYNCYLETYSTYEMDPSKKEALRKIVENIKSEGNRNVEPRDMQVKSTNYDLNIMCDSFTYLCTTSHLEPLLKSAWWITTNWQRNQGIASGQQNPGPSSSAPSTSGTIMAADHAVSDTRQLKPEVTVTPSLKRPQTAVGRTEIPIKKRRINNE